jgi:hypothetical protein
MSKKIPEELAKYSGSSLKAPSRTACHEPWRKKLRCYCPFREYGFKEIQYRLWSHRAPDCHLKYICPLFAMLTNEVNDTDKMIKYITECRRGY